MNITEKTKEYAKGKALDAISAAIEQAYADGYNEGFNDGVRIGKITTEDWIGLVEYKNMGLQKEWSSTFVKDEKGKIKLFSYDKALKYPIPTVEDYKELILNCNRTEIRKSKSVSTGIKYYGVNSNEIHLPNSEFEYGGNLKPNSGYFFWLKDKNYEGNDARCATINRDEDNVSHTFKGNKLPILLVR